MIFYKKETEKIEIVSRPGTALITQDRRNGNFKGGVKFTHPKPAPKWSPSRVLFQSGSNISPDPDRSILKK